jgi:hypothetical protein
LKAVLGSFQVLPENGFWGVFKFILEWVLEVFQILLIMVLRGFLSSPKNDFWEVFKFI